MSDIIERLDRIERFLPIPEYLGIDWLAAKYGVSGGYLRARRAALPNFGITDTPGKNLWHRDLCAKWVQTSIRDHLLAFERLPAAQQRQIMAAWKATA